MLRFHRVDREVSSLWGMLRAQPCSQPRAGRYQLPENVERGGDPEGSGGAVLSWRVVSDKEITKEWSGS